jgi:pimeloyl-ACP methyl ester carboxylesterase
VLVEERIETNGIPARLYLPGRPKGLLLLGHGGGKSKDSERFIELSRLYAESTDLAVVCIDALDHGERKPVGVDDRLPTEWHSRSMRQTVDDWTATASALSWIGPPLAYVGFSMGSIFGIPVVESQTSIKVAVFVVGGVPSGGWIQDPPLRSLLLSAASRLSRPHVLMVNKTQDELFPVEGVQDLFTAIPGQDKSLSFWEGTHDDWPPEAIDQTITFINSHLK